MSDEEISKSDGDNNVHLLRDLPAATVAVVVP
jgi:hypothetical protein